MNVYDHELKAAVSLKRNLDDTINELSAEKRLRIECKTTAEIVSKLYADSKSPAHCSTKSRDYSSMSRCESIKCGPHYI